MTDLALYETNISEMEELIAGTGDVADDIASNATDMALLIAANLVN